MNTPLFRSPLKIGDLVVRPKALGFVDHYGVAVSDRTILQNTPERGEHVCDVDQFAAGQKVRVIPGTSPAHEVLQRAGKVLASPKPWQVSRNCEHTANEVAQGRAFSTQLVAFATVIIAAGIIYAVFRRS